MTDPADRCDVAIVATYDWISQLIKDFVVPFGWRAVSIPGEDVGRAGARLRSCRVVLCDLDLPPQRLAAVRRAGIPIIYFSGSRRGSEIDLPEDGAGYFDLPPDRAELDRLIRSLI
ncbi:MAG TPA: hypothetical protein VF188_01315 [Longimicrobiales bacterium]